MFPKADAGQVELLTITLYPSTPHLSTREKTSLQERLKTWVMPKLFMWKEHIKLPNASILFSLQLEMQS